VEVNTVDGFQGREVDVVILSCVRTAGTGPGNGPDPDGTPSGSGSGSGSVGIGFVRDRRRLNVALTRARLALWVVGDARTLARHSGDWAALVREAGQRRCLRTDRDVG
jgi:senataxin